MAGKEAIAFVIDASPSMASPYGVTPGDDDQQEPQRQQDTAANTRAGSQQGDLEDEQQQPIELPESQMSAMGAEAEADLLGTIEDEVGNLGDDDTSNNSKTRLSAAKEACVAMIANLILQSKTNECSVVVCKSDRTKHHLCAPEQVEAGTAPFKNILELSEMNSPGVSLLREVMAVQPTVKQEADQDSGSEDMMDLSPKKADSASGDLCDGIIVASDALFRKTDKKKYKRRLVVFTDAQHEINVDESQLMMVVEGLKKLECTLTVIGLDFVNSAEFDRPATEDDAGGDAMEEGNGSDEEEEEEEDDEEEEGSDDDSDDDDEDDETEEERKARIKDENEKLLISLAKLTGGKVIAASTLQQVLDSTRGKRIPKSTRRKVKEFKIAPGLSIEARFSLMLSRANIKSLKREVVLVDDEGNPKKNSLEEEMMAGVEGDTSHWDADKPGQEVPAEKRTKAYKYGADLIPVGVWDETSLKMFSPVSITILGYMSQAKIPRYLRIGDPYAVTGEDDSRRSAVAISALAQALHKEGCAAICKFVKTKDSDPILAALFPLIEDENEGDNGVNVGSGSNGETNANNNIDDEGSDGSGSGDEDGDENGEGAGSTSTARPKGPHRLYLVQLPFAKDVNTFCMAPLDDETNEVDASKCDALIDSLMLPDDCLQSEKIGNPAVRSFNKTLIDRAIDPNAPLAFTRSKGPNDPMSCPADIKERAKGAIDAFLSAFPTRPEEVSQKGNKKTTGSSKPTFLGAAAY